MASATATKWIKADGTELRLQRSWRMIAELSALQKPPYCDPLRRVTQRPIT